MSPRSPHSNPLAGFGPNEWLVYEIYQQYLTDPYSVDRAWWDFFADYQPPDNLGGDATRDGGRTAAAPPANGGTAGETGAVGRASAAPPAADVPPAEAPNGRSATEPATSAPQSAAPSGTSPEPQPAVPSGTGAPDGAVRTLPLRGTAARVVSNMETSLGVPTATSVRAVPAKLLEDNRLVINNHLRRGRGGKVSFTHLIGYAVVRALAAVPEMNRAYAEVDGKPAVVVPEHVNLGLAIDLAREDGSRTLVVPSIPRVDTLDFAKFWAAYEDIVRRARANRLTVADYAGTTLSLTNPGTLGTVQSVPRLMSGQGTIIAVGAMEYPAEYSGASAETLARMAISKVLTLTSTYDHRIIQGAQSGEFLRRISDLLLGADNFYDDVFRSLRIPYRPIRWLTDIAASHEDEVSKPARVYALIHAYRVRGHLMADTNPLEFRQRDHPDLDIVGHGLSLWDLDRQFPTGGFGAMAQERGRSVMPLREILGVLRDSYCRTVGIEYMHLQDPEQRRWIRSRVERPHTTLEREEQLRILQRLNGAEAFEAFLQTKYVGQKRFSLEGGESVIALLDAILAEAARSKLDEVVIGMPHRGRLNVLANIVGKSYAQIFREFEGNLDPRTAHGSGDVKYHLGDSGTYRTEEGQTVAVSLVSNPSHLEAVDPVLEGVVRAKQDKINRAGTAFTVLPLLLHGDAAFAGQGVVAETLNLSQLRGYRTGGTVHVVVNNQVGFTTAPAAARSTVYATDVARMIQAPIFHINGDDPEACVRFAKLAFEFRQTFAKDVVLDLICYRRRGHSEVDEPSFTQPVMYDLIDAKRSVRKIYTESLVGRGDISVEEAESALRDYQGQLERVFAETHEAGGPAGTGAAPAARENTGAAPAAPQEAADAPPGGQPPDESDPVTAVSREVLKRIADSQVNLPSDFVVHERLLPQLHRRARMLDEDAVDWAAAETFAMGSLLLDGRPVRLAGQDSRRGTFGQRHAVLVDQRTGAEHTPLAELTRSQQGAGTFHIFDSLLSEFAAMGFEYGYSVARPEALVMWEAQFGDFANGAQTIIDEFISAGEEKWGQRSGVVLLLPHGFEGQGPDHSSGRPERYLALCAENNMIVCMPSTPASYFHLLRRQALCAAHKPLVVFTPKSMLRLRAATSKAVEFTDGAFAPVLPDPEPPAGSVTRVLLCSGKVTHDLLAARRKRGVTDTALLRVEQLYPLPAGELWQALAAYPDARDLVWVQEEPANMGAWQYMALNLREALDSSYTLRRVSRRASASPAAGSTAMHEAEQVALLDRVFS